MTMHKLIRVQKRDISISPPQRMCDAFTCTSDALRPWITHLLVGKHLHSSRRLSHHLVFIVISKDHFDAHEFGTLSVAG